MNTADPRSGGVFSEWFCQKLAAGSFLLALAAFSCSVGLAQTHYVVDNLADVLASDGTITLREALQAANADAAYFDAPAGNGHDTITFDPDLFAAGPQVLWMAGFEFAISKAITITGPGRDLLALDAGDNSRIFRIDDGVSSRAIVNISALTVRNGDLDEPGGGIWSREALTLEAVAISDNRCTPSVSGSDNFWNGGGGIYIYNGTLLLVDSEVSDNWTHLAGGGVLGSTSSTITIFSSQILRNHGGDEGGGIGMSDGGSLTVFDSLVADNTSSDDGGGIGLRSSISTLNLFGCTVIQNTRGPNANAGGIWSPGGNTVVTIEDCLVADNIGRGAFLAGSGTVTRCHFLRNDSSNDGGVATGRYGGGLRFSGNGHLQVVDCLFESNMAGNGGGLYVAGGSATVTRCTFFDNFCITSAHGGAIAGSTNVTVENCTLSSNRAGPTGQGGGVYIVGGNWTVRNSTISGNTSTMGGGIRLAGGSLTMHSAIIANNIAPTAKDVSAIVTGQFNLVEDSSGSVFMDSGNIFGVDPALGPLDDYGGLTWTHRLLPNSPAINAGSNPAGLTVDQRGNQRVVGGQADIGSFERAEPASVLAEEVAVTWGLHVSGSVAELAASDDAYFKVRRSMPSHPGAGFDVGGVSPIAVPSSLSVRLESSVEAQRPVNQSIELYDYVAGNWVQVDYRASSRTTDLVAEVTAGGDVSRFVQPGTGFVEARVRYHPTFTTLRFVAKVDQFSWTVGE